MLVSELLHRINECQAKVRFQRGHVDSETAGVREMERQYNFALHNKRVSPL